MRHVRLPASRTTRAWCLRGCPNGSLLTPRASVRDRVRSADRINSSLSALQLFAETLALPDVVVLRQRRRPDVLTTNLAAAARTTLGSEPGGLLGAQLGLTDQG